MWYTDMMDICDIKSGNLLNGIIEIIIKTKC